MKKLLLACLLAGLPAAAEEAKQAPRMVVVRQDLVQMNEATALQLRGQSRLPAGYERDSRFHLLESSEVLAAAGTDGFVMVGRKYPVSYYDPRGSQFQIQYVDVGFKSDFKLQLNGDDVALTGRGEVSETVTMRTPGTPPGPATYPETAAFISQIRTDGHLGDNLIVGRTQGPSAQQWLQKFGVTGSGTDCLALIYTVTEVK